MFPTPENLFATVISSGHHQRLPLPNNNEAIATYHPQLDLLYFRTTDRPEDDRTATDLDADWTFADPIELNIDTIADAYIGDTSTGGGLTTSDIFDYIGLDFDSVAHHEHGHAILSKTTAKNNPSLFINISENQRFGALLDSSKLESDYLQKTAIDLVVNEARTAFIENLATPVHETMATISEAVNSDGPTVSNLQKRLFELNTLIDGPTGWTLRHPGYSPFEQTEDTGDDEWLQFLRSYEFTILAAVKPLFAAFDDILIISLLTAGATASIRAPAANPESLTDDIHHLLPSVSFFSGVMQLEDAARFYEHLRLNGASISRLAGMYEENVAQGGEAVDIPGEAFEEHFEALAEGLGAKSGRAYYELVHNRVNKLRIPSYIIHEDTTKHSIELYYFAEGLGPSVLTMTMLRWVFIESIYIGTPQFLNQPYSNTVKQLIERSNGFSDNATDVLKRATYLAGRLVEDLDRQELARNIRDRYDYRSGTGWQGLTNELGAGMYPTTRRDMISNSAPLEYKAARVAGRPYRGDLTAIGIRKYRDFWTYARRNSPIDSFAKQIEVISEFSETSPHTPRLNGVYWAFADWAEDRENSDKLTAKFFGRILGRELFVEREKWVQRYYTDYLEWSRYAEDFESSFDTLFIYSAWTIFQRAARQNDFERAETAIADLVSLLFSEWDESVFHSGEITVGIGSTVTKIFREFASDLEDRTKALDAFTSGIIIALANLDEHPPVKDFLNGIVTGFSGIFQHGSPTDFQDEYIIMKGFIEALADLGMTENIWNRYAQMFPELMLDGSNYDRAEEWLVQEGKLLERRIEESSSDMAISQEMYDTVNWELILSNFSTMTLIVLLRQYQPPSAENLLAWIFDQAHATLSSPRIRPIYVQSLLGLAEEYQSSDEVIEWWVKIKEAMIRWSPAVNKRTEFVSLFGEILAIFELTNINTESREWLPRISDLMQSIAGQWDLPLDVQMAAFGFATAKTARDVESERNDASMEVNRLRSQAIQYLESGNLTNSAFASALEQYEAAIVVNHTLFTNRKVALESLWNLLSTTTIQLWRVDDETSLAAVLGDAVGEIYHPTTIESIDSPFGWMRLFDGLATEWASRSISRPKFATCYLGSMFTSLLSGYEANSRTADSNTELVNRMMAMWSDCPEINLDILECAVFVYAISDIERACDGRQQSEWLRHLFRLAVTRIDPDSWQHFKQQRPVYEPGQRIDFGPSIKALDGFLL